jgi:hypothetical protein
VRKIDFLVGRNGGVGGWWVNPSSVVVHRHRHLISPHAPLLPNIESPGQTTHDEEEFLLNNFDTLACAAPKTESREAFQIRVFSEWFAVCWEVWCQPE